MRDAAAILLENPKYDHNVGQIVRAASGYGVPTVRWTGERVPFADPHVGKYRLPREERLRDYAKVGKVWVPNGPLIPALTNTTVVGVEVLPGTESLMAFEHPESAMYVFGPEDGTLSKGVRAQCHRFVIIPTEHCINLSAAVYTVLYDRRLKQFQAGLIGSHEVVP